MAHDDRERYLIRYAGDFAPFVVAKAEGAWVETTDGRADPRLHVRADQLDAGSQPPAHRRGDRALAARGHPPQLLDGQRGRLELARRLAEHAAGPAGAVDAAQRRLGDQRGRVPAGEVLHRPLRDRRAHARLPRAAGRDQLGDLHDGPQGLRPVDARQPRDPRALRVPLPDPPLLRHVRHDLPRRRLRDGRPGLGRIAGGDDGRAGALHRRHHPAPGGLPGAAPRRSATSAGCC